MPKAIDINENRIKILQLIFERPGITIPQLAEAVGMHPSAVYRTLKMFENEYKIIKLVSDTGKVYKIYPTGYVKCLNSVFILPYIYETKDNKYIIAPQVIRCPYYDECPYRGKGTFVPGLCKLYDELSTEDKFRIQKMLRIIADIVENVMRKEITKSEKSNYKSLDR